jgi:ABC-type uncharacterized transport system
MSREPTAKRKVDSGATVTPEAQAGAQAGRARAGALRFGMSAAQLLGIAAVAAIALLVNVLAVRHYRRFDLTQDKRYSLSPATITTLHELTQPVDLWILMSNGDPLRESVRQMLVAYGGETDKLTAHYIDPDRDPAAYLDVRAKFRMEAGRNTADVAAGAGVSSDAVIVVSQANRHWFIAPNDLVTIENADDPRAKPREERALTGALRNVVSGAKTEVCFATGHGELDPDDGGEQGLGFLVSLLEKDNYSARTVDATALNTAAPYKGCAVVLVAGPRGPWAAEDANHLRTYLLEGGSGLIAVSPINADTDNGMVAPGLAQVTAPFGIQLDEDLVFETDPRLVFPNSRGIRFGTAAKPHPITQGLLVDANPKGAPRIIAHFTRSLRAEAGAGVPVPSPLLVTSMTSYGVRNIAGAKDWEAAPPKKVGDPEGPLTIAMASERAKVGADAAHGPRLVVFGTGSSMIRTNWKTDGQGRGMALAVENSIAWLTSKPEVLDVPEKQALAAGIRVTEDDKSAVFRYVIVLMPLAWVVLGAVVLFLRRSREGAPWKA